MKNRKSALRKAVMAAMLAGAITTTGGVKAQQAFREYEELDMVRAREAIGTKMEYKAGHLARG